MEKKYRLTMKESEDTATTEIIILQTQNKNLIEMLSMLQEQFPGLKRNLKRAASSLLTWSFLLSINFHLQFYFYNILQ